MHAGLNRVSMFGVGYDASLRFYAPMPPTFGVDGRW